MRQRKRGKNSKYQMFFESWINDQHAKRHAKRKPTDNSREDDLSR